MVCITCITAGLLVGRGSTKCPVEYDEAVASLQRCDSTTTDNLVTMVWTSSASTFKARNQWALESLLASQPCSRVQVISNTLPLDFFETFVDFGFSVRVVRFDLSAGSDLVGPARSPGSVWAQGLDEWAKQRYFYVHLSDMLRLFVLYRFGGTYLDFDHIVLRSMHELPPNTIGSEICQDDNPDCLTGEQLADIGVIGGQSSNGWSGPWHIDDGGGDAKATVSRMEFDAKTRYTPCNGVMVNWVPKHPLLAAALSFADEHYDPGCWGCLGPRLFGRLLIEAERGEAQLLSLEPPGCFYPFDYKEAGIHLNQVVCATESMMTDPRTMGVHFYGKMTSGVELRFESTMGRAVRAHTLFKVLGERSGLRESSRHDWKFVVRKPWTQFCVADAVAANQRRSGN